MPARLKAIIPLLFLASYASAQIFNPATWEFSYEKKAENQYELIFSATIEEGSHIYSMDVPDGGPIPTTIRFDSTAAWTAVGKSFEFTKPEEAFDEAFGFKIKSFSEKAEFRQKITSKEPTFTVTGAVNYMACNNATCSPPQDVEFSITISDGSSAASSGVKPAADSASGLGLLGFFLISMLAGFAACCFDKEGSDYRTGA